jgi:hypothetical protein
MSCQPNRYICNCTADFPTYWQLEDHIVEHANNKNSGHYYKGRCCDCGCTKIND